MTDPDEQLAAELKQALDAEKADIALASERAKKTIADALEKQKENNK